MSALEHCVVGSKSIQQPAALRLIYLSTTLVGRIGPRWYAQLPWVSLDSAGMCALTGHPPLRGMRSFYVLAVQAMTGMLRPLNHLFSGRS